MMWLLLMSLLVSDLSPLGDGDRVTGYYSWSLRGKVLLGGQVTPRGPWTLLTQTKHHCKCVQRSCVRVAVRHKRRTSPFCSACTVHDDHGNGLSPQDLTEMIHRSHIPALVVSLLHEEGKAYLKSDPLPAMHVISRDTPTKAGGGISHSATDIIKDPPNSGSASSLHHHAAASGHDFQALTLQKSKSWAAATIAQQQKTLTERYRAATTGIIFYCLKEGEIRSAMSIKKISREQMRQKQSTQRRMDIKVLRQHDGEQSLKASVGQRDVFQTASLHSGSPSVKAPDTSQLEIKRRAASVMKKNEHLNLDEGSASQRNLQKRFSLKAASSADGDEEDDDGFYVKRQLLLESGEKKESTNRPRYKLRAALDDHKEDLNGKIIAKQVELRRPEGEGEAERSHTNAVENGSRKRLAYILQTGSAYKMDNNDVDHKQMLTEVGEEALITLFLPQTEPASERKLILKADTGWKTVNMPSIKEPADPQVIQQNFIIEADNSKCKCLKETFFSLDVCAIERRRGIDVKPAESVAEVTTAPAYTKVKEPTETNNTPQENMSINHTQQERNAPPEGSDIPSPPSYKIMETETTTTTAVTTAVNTEIKQTGTRKADGLTATDGTPATTASPRPETDTEPRITKRQTASAESTPGNPFSGLRMREGVAAATAEPPQEENEDGYMILTRPGSASKGTDPGVSSFALSDPSERVHKHAANSFPESTDEPVPLCRGLIHRTEAGWKHCVERSAGAGSKATPSRGPLGAFTEPGELQEENTSVRDRDADEDDHFYYFDGVLKRVQNNFYPPTRIRGRRKRSRDDSEDRVPSARDKGDAQENLLSYIRRLSLRNRVK